MGNKSFKISEHENDWGGFLYDLDCSGSSVIRRIFIPGEPTARKKDPETVTEARNGAKIIVTSNGRDFVRFTIDCQKRENYGSCEDCWGLVIVPNKEFDREYSLRKADIKNGIRIAGEILPWKAVGYANLCVAINREGAVRISRFERCQFCEKAYPLTGQQWYDVLPIAHAAQRPETQSKS